MRIVVTGGAGFIGGNLCRVLASRGVDVTVVDDLSAGSMANLAGLDVDMRVGSVLDRDLLTAACRNAHSVVHLAAAVSVPQTVAEPVATHEVNTNGTVNVLEAVRQAGTHLVVASSAAVYGNGPELRKTESLPGRPMSPYAAHKLAAEGYTMAYQRSYGLPALIFRFFNVFGPLQLPGHAYAAVVPAFVSAAIAGRPLRIFGDGHQVRDFVDVGTVVGLLAEAAVEHRAHDGPVNLCLGRRTTVLELVRLLEEAVGRPLPRAHVGARPGDVRDSHGDPALLRVLFPDLQAVPLPESLARTVDWYVHRTS